VSAASEPILTLEPLIEAVTEGVETVGWVRSGVQKTTSHEYGGRWEGETSRSAYLFFHRPSREESVSVDVFLDETSRGIEGNLALVVDGPALADLGDAREALAAVAAATRERIREPRRVPVALRLRLPDPTQAVDAAAVELRVKIPIPDAALRSGHGAVAALASAGVRAFERLLEHPELRRYEVDGG
jgi:hypothetical protein